MILPAADLDHILVRSRQLWAEARGQAFFFTGGTGFLGRWLLESFVHANGVLGLDARAVVLTRDPAAAARKAPHLFERKEIDWVKGDVRTFQFPRGKFAYVIHAATDSSARLSREAPEELIDTIIAGTRRVFDFARQADSRKIVFTSSGAVYGRQPQGLGTLPEDYTGSPDPLLPASAYGESKRLAELMSAVAASQHGLEMKDCPVLLLHWPSPAAGFALRRWKLHSRRAAPSAHPGNR